jgi:rhomboid protease GluP
MANDPSQLPPSGVEPQAPPQSRRAAVKVPQVSPTVTYTLMGIIIFVFVMQGVSVLLFGVDIPAAIGLKANSLIAQGQVWRLFTPIFLHASPDPQNLTAALLHVGFNLYALYVLGPGLERVYGHKRFLVLFILSGFAGNVMSFLFSTAPSLGASTAIFGMIGAEGVFLYQNREILGDSARQGLRNVIVIALINLFIGVAPGSNIDNWGHIGGLLGGALFAWFAGPVLKVEGIFPSLSVVDQRESGDVIRAGLSVGLLFTLLTVATIFLRK